MAQNYSDLNKERSLKGKKSTDQIKTTDVNILLNRVRLEKKKDSRKNLLVSFLILSLICSITILFII